MRFRDAELDLTTRPATADERTEVWRTASSVHPGYTKYQERITGRDIRIFILEPPT